MHIYFTVSQKSVLENILTIFQICSACWFSCSSFGASSIGLNIRPSSLSFLVIALIALSFFFLSFLSVLIGSMNWFIIDSSAFPSIEFG
jgi:hypothetical protein